MPDINIYDALRESHRVQRTLCRKLLRATTHGGGRREIYRELKIERAATSILNARLRGHDGGVSFSAAKIPDSSALFRATKIDPL